MRSSETPPATSGTSFERRRSVSRSSTMLEALFVMSSRKSDSIGWYTYLISVPHHAARGRARSARYTI